MKYYFGHIQDENELLSVASGGICTAIARYYLNNDGVVYGKRYSEDYRSIKNIRVVSHKQLNLLKGSKYIWCNEGLPFADIIRDLNERKRVVFLGLPCEVAALLHTLDRKGVDRERLLTVDLICHGPTSPAVASEYLDALEKKYRSKVKNASTRYKKGSWTPAYFHAEFENGEEFSEPFYETEYGIAFIHYIRKSCYECKYKGDAHLADITVGDGWGIPKEHCMYHKNGVSTVVVRSKKAEDILTELPNFVYAETTEDVALSSNPRYYFPPERSNECIRFEEDYKHYGLHKACVKTLSIKRRIKRLLPRRVIAVIGNKTER